MELLQRITKDYRFKRNLTIKPVEQGPYIEHAQYGKYLILGDHLPAANLKQIGQAHYEDHYAISMDDKINQDFIYSFLKKYSPKEVFFIIDKEESIKAHIPFIKKIAYDFDKKIQFRTDKDFNVLIGLAIQKPINPPQRAVIEIFNACNLKCDFCFTHSPLIDQDEYSKQWLKKRLSLDVFKKYVDELATFKPDLVELCAVGDPLFHPEVWQMMDYLKNKNLKIRISTNGTLITKKRAHLLMDMGLAQLFMNISAGDRDTYAQVHNVEPEIYDHLKENLTYLAQLKKEHKDRIPFIRSINVLTSKTLKNIGEIIDFSESIATDFIDFRKVWAHKIELRELALTQKEAEPVLNKKEELLAQVRKTGIKNNLEDFFRNLENELFPTDGGVPAKAMTEERVEYKTTGACAVSYHFTLLDINENLRYCCHGVKTVERYKSIGDIWREKKYNNFRQHWAERFAQQKGLCEGCPHQDENVYYGKKLINLGLDEFIKR